MVLVSRIPELFTGICTLGLAAERFILVVLPYDASTLLCKRNRVVVYSIIVAITTALTCVELSFQYISYLESRYQCNTIPAGKHCYYTETSDEN